MLTKLIAIFNILYKNYCTLAHVYYHNARLWVYDDNIFKTVYTKWKIAKRRTQSIHYRTRPPRPHHCRSFIQLATGLHRYRCHRRRRRHRLVRVRRQYLRSPWYMCSIGRSHVIIRSEPFVNSYSYTHYVRLSKSRHLRFWK